jgi:hypothetical protein
MKKVNPSFVVRINPNTQRRILPSPPTPYTHTRIIKYKNPRK